MASPRWQKKPDANQQDIVDALRRVGAKVYDASRVGEGFPDLIIGFRQCLFLLEVKTSSGRLTKDQKKFHAEWDSYIHIVHTVEEALRVIGLNSG
jgi:hypothetical protein